MKVIKKILILIGFLFLFPVLFISTLTIYWQLRTPPSFDVDPVLKLETWTAVPPGDNIRTQHNANTDLIFYDGYFYLIHAQSKWHLEDKNGALLVKRSIDAREWETVAKITVPDTDVRDPKFAIIRDRLFVYFLPNRHFDPEPETTYFTSSDDGVIWDVPRELDTISVTNYYPDGTSEKVTSGGWNLWRPKSFDNETWYVMASGKKYAEDVPFNYGGRIEGYQVEEEGKAHMIILIKTNDGVSWEEVSDVYVAKGVFEPCLEFTPEGKIISTIRSSSLGTGGYAFGNPTANTIIAVSEYPYTYWECFHSFITRLDGATLFELDGRIFAAGRNHLGPRFDMGNNVAKKRTAFFEVKENGLLFLFDLPSNGDTSYTGVAERGDDIYVSYYTCPINKDYPWVLGVCFLPKTEIRMAKLSASGLLDFADKKW